MIGLFLLLAVLVAFAAWYVHALSTSGAAAAALCGWIALIAGWDWAILLITYFISASLISLLSKRRKRDSTSAGIIEKSGTRDAWQVFANGGVFLVLAIAWILAPSPAWWIGGASALAASAADTFATEIGTLSQRPPRSILTGDPVPTGTSGGVSWLGTGGAVLGAGIVTAVAAVANMGQWTIIPIFAAGMVGMLVDSLLGATAQARRNCPVCQRHTERVIHTCGARTHLVGGIGCINNDVVNLLTTLVAALIAMLWYAAHPLVFKT